MELKPDLQKPRRQLPPELLSEIAKCVPLKIVSKRCVKPINESILLANWSFTSFLRKPIRQRLDMIAQLMSEKVRYDREDWFIYRLVDGRVTALDSLTLMRHLYLGSLLYTDRRSFRGHFSIWREFLPGDFQPAVFLEQFIQLAVKTPNPETMAQFVEFVFPRPNELPATFTRDDLDIQQIVARRETRLLVENEWVENIRIRMSLYREDPLDDVEDYATAVFNIKA